MDKEKRIVYLNGEVDGLNLKSVYEELLDIITDDDKQEAEKKEFTRKPIKLYINSKGGDVYEMWNIVDLILTSKTPIHTYCTGYVMSAGFIIFLAGCKRFTTPHATFMYHQHYNYTFGKYMDLVEDLKENEWVYNTMNEFVLSRVSGITAEMIKENDAKKKDWYIHSEEALKLGIVDEIIGG